MPINPSNIELQRLCHMVDKSMTSFIAKRDREAQLKAQVASLQRELTILTGNPEKSGSSKR